MQVHVCIVYICPWLHTFNSNTVVYAAHTPDPLARQEHSPVSGPQQLSELSPNHAGAHTCIEKAGVVCID